MTVHIMKLLMDNALAGVIIDRFGKDVMMKPVDEGHFSVRVDVAVSQQFIGWVFALGSGARIIGLKDVVEQAGHEIKRLMEQYNVK